MLHSVRVEPPPSDWAGLMQRDHIGSLLGQSVEHWRAATRRELLGQEFNHVVATGHQAGFWHPGILAKYLALDVCGEKLGAEALVELVVDQDEDNLRFIEAPAIDVEDVLIASPVRWTHWRDKELARPSGFLPPILAEPGAWRLTADHVFAIAGMQVQVRAMGRALILLASAASRAEQFALAAAVLREVRFANHRLPAIVEPTADPWASRRFLVSASRMTGTSLWRVLLDRLRHDPEAAWTAYNGAVAAHPEAGIIPLEKRVTGGCEIPCWLISEAGHRHRAFEHDLRRSDALLWPRALLMTGLVRLALADLFIHGQGGYQYDRITEQWFRDWLGCELAPITMVTATMTLDFNRQPPDPAELARAHWLVHHVPYNIDRFLDDRSHLEQRGKLLAEIDALPRGSVRRRELFERMRSAQRRLAARYEEMIVDTRRYLRATQRRMEETSVVNRRTWAFPLFPQSALRELAAGISRAFGAE